MAVAGTVPTTWQLTNTGKMQSARCRLCRIAREARGESTDGLAVETYGYINSAGCEGMTTTVMAAHHSIWGHLYDRMHLLQKSSSLSRLTKKVIRARCGGEKSFSKCMEDDLADKVQAI